MTGNKGKFKYIIFGFISIIFFLSSAKSVFSDIVINEIMPHPSGNDDWVEIYSNNPEDKDISNWQLEDSTGTFLTFNERTKVASFSYKIISKSKRLNNSGDTVKLKDNTGSVIDSVSYSDDPGIDVSLGKCSDKNDSWGILTNSSPGESNSLCMVIPSLTPTVYITLTVKPKPSSTPTPIVTQKFVTAVKEQVIKSTSDTLKKTTTPILSYVNKIVEEGNISTEAGNTILGKTVEISPDYSREPDAQFLLQKSRINQSVPILIFSGFCLLTASVIWSVYIAKLNRSR